MDKKTYFKMIWSLGNLVTGYSELKAFDTNTAITLARLNTEYNYAVGHNYLIDNYCFAYDEKEIANSIGLTVEDVKTSIKILEDLDLIETEIIKDFNLMHLELGNICRFIEKAEKKGKFKLWCHGLDSIQSNAFKNIEFNEENKKLIEVMKNRKNEFATDENGNFIYF